MIKQILFDCGGVLTEMKFKDKMLEISGSEAASDYFINNIWSEKSPWHKYDRGEIDTDEVLKQLKEFMQTHKAMAEEERFKTLKSLYKTPEHSKKVMLYLQA